jgi:hypothetical protein
MDVSAKRSAAEFGANVIARSVDRATIVDADVNARATTNETTSRGHRIPLSSRGHRIPLSSRGHRIPLSSRGHRIPLSSLRAITFVSARCASLRLTSIAPTPLDVQFHAAIAAVAIQI